MRFRGEMTGGEELHDGIRVVAPIRFCAGWNEKWIVPTPNREERRLRFSKVVVKCRVELDVVGIVEKEIQLNPHISPPKSWQRRECNLRVRSSLDFERPACMLCSAPPLGEHIYPS